jgi:hypothetical protein
MPVVDHVSSHPYNLLQQSGSRKTLGRRLSTARRHLPTVSPNWLIAAVAGINDSVVRDLAIAGESGHRDAFR